MGSARCVFDKYDSQCGGGETLVAPTFGMEIYYDGYY